MTKIDSFVPLDAGMFIPPLHLACDLKIGSERLLFCCIWPLLDSMLKLRLKLVVPYMVVTNGHFKCNMTNDHYIVVCCVFSACDTEIHGVLVVVYHLLGMIQAHHCTDSIQGRPRATLPTTAPPSELPQGLSLMFPKFPLSATKQ